MQMLCKLSAPCGAKNKPGAVQFYMTWSVRAIFMVTIRYADKRLI